MSGVSMRHAAFWARVQDALDRRRDPLDEAGVRESLERHPELLEGFAELRAALTAMGSGVGIATPVAAGRRLRNIRVAAVAAVILVLLSIAVWSVLPVEAPEPEIVLPDLATTGEVLTYRARSFTEGPECRIEHSVDAGSLTILERAIVTRVHAGAAANQVHDIRTVRSKTVNRIRSERLLDRP